MVNSSAETQSARKILLVNGPNLNLLGQREPEKYGTTFLKDIVDRAEREAVANGFQLQSMQSNSEGEIVDAIQAARGDIAFILINAGALTHSSIAIRDAFLAVEIPFIELHLSNVFARESFRHHSVLADIAIGLISGFGDHSYELALNAAMQHLNNQ